MPRPVGLSLLGIVAVLALYTALCPTASSSSPADHIGRWNSPPEYCGPGSKLNGGNTDAPLLGNGDFGVSGVCGAPGRPTFYLGKNDFWSTYNADVTHNMYQSLAAVARLQLDLQSLVGTTAAAAGNNSKYQLAQHLANASVTSTVQSDGGAQFSTRSVVATSSNVLVTELVSSQDTVVTISLTTGSATGTRRGLPVAAGRSGDDGIYIARNSSSAVHTHPSAVVRDCRDALLDSFGQQSFAIDPTTGRLSVLDGNRKDRSRCLLLLPAVADAAEPVRVSTRGIPATDSTWLSFADHNAMYFPTKTSAIHSLGLFSTAQDCQSHIDSNVSLAKMCSIYAWSKGSQSCYCREDAVWEFTAQPGRTSGCRPAVVKGCSPTPTPHPYRPHPPHPAPGPPRPPPPPLCTMTSHCTRVGSAADLAECAAAGNAGVWHLEAVAGGSRVVHNSSTLGKLCLTDSQQADPEARCGSVGKCFPVLEARPCASDGYMRAAQLWNLGGPLKQLRSSGSIAVRGEATPAGAESSQCVTAIPPVPLIQVAAAVRVLGQGAKAAARTTTPTRLDDGSIEINMTLEMRAGEVYTMATAVVSSNDLAQSKSSKSVISAAELMLDRVCTTTGVASLRQQHAHWWAKFWNASSVDLGAERRTLEAFWFGMQYMAGSMNRAGKQATGLWGPWIQSDDMNWNGDYTLDYNFQSSYYGAFSSNHVELAANFYPVIEKAMAIGRRRAAYPHWGDRGEGHSGPAGMILSQWHGSLGAKPLIGNFSGVELPSHVTAYGGYYMGDLGTRGLIGWVALPFVDHVDYTLDLEFLSNHTYPVLLAGADFFESYLTYHPSNQTYTLEDACALEGCTLPNSRNSGKPQQNVAMTLGWIRSTFQALLRFSAILGVDEERKPTWRKILNGLAAFPTTQSRNQTVFDECENSGDFGGNNRYPVVYFGPIHPAAQITRRSASADLLQTARNTVEQINSMNAWVPDNGLCMAWPPAAVVTDNASQTSLMMQGGLHRAMSPNFVPQIHGGCVAEQAGATQAINDLMMSSYDGLIELFPAGWVEESSASFTTLRARGAFLVSASWNHSAVLDGVTLLSEAGSDVAMVNPFSSQSDGELPLVLEQDSGAVVNVTRVAGGNTFGFATTPGKSYTISRQSARRKASPGHNE